MNNGSETIHQLVVKKALEIAKKDLRSCYAGPGIIAGKRHFDDYWARDSFFASWGALAIGDFNQVKDNLSFFISFQKNDGLIPRKIDRFYLTRFKYLTNIRIPRIKVKPVYKGRFRYPNIDPNSIFVITAEKYVLESGDKKWLSDNILAINKALFWIKDQNQDEDLLVEEGTLANWMDTVRKFHKLGKTFYSNVLAWKALECGENLNKMAGRNLLGELKTWKNILKEKITEVFWNGEYFSDWVSRGKRFDYFATDGNLFAIILGLASEQQSLQILKSMDKYFGREPIPRPVNYPAYPKRNLALRHALSGLPGYHNAYGRWLWIAALSALAHKIMGKEERFLQEISIVSDWILTNQKVFEVYRPDGTPYHRPFWKSESPFAWNAGIFIWCVKELNLF